MFSVTTRRERRSGKGHLMRDMLTGRLVSHTCLTDIQSEAGGMACARVTHTHVMVLQ